MSEPIRLLAGPPSPAPEPERAPVDRSAARAPKEKEEALLAALDGIRDAPAKVQFGTGSAEFSYDADLDRVVVRIYSSETEPREIVRQIPPEDYMTFAARYRELLGVMFDEKV